MKKPVRLIIEVGTIANVSIYDILDGMTPEQVKAKMDDIIDEFAGRDVYFYTDTYGYDGGVELTLRERRPETDDEMQERLEAEAKQARIEADKKKKKTEQELKEYLRLKKKFEKAGL